MGVGFEALIGITVRRVIIPGGFAIKNSLLPYHQTTSVLFCFR